MKEDRVAKAIALFKEGYNCSQSVVAAFADEYGFTREQALRMAASFGGGIGRMRETCGAACGMFLLAGLETGATEGSDRGGRIQAQKRCIEMCRLVGIKQKRTGYFYPGSPHGTVLCQASVCKDGGRSC